MVQYSYLPLHQLGREFIAQFEVNCYNSEYAGGWQSGRMLAFGASPFAPRRCELTVSYRLESQGGSVDRMPDRKLARG